jgi:hypothetical protein
MKAIRTNALKIRDGNILAFLPKLSGQKLAGFRHSGWLR